MSAPFHALRLTPSADWHRKVAFTLVELIAVMSLIALFAGVLGYAFMRGGNQTVGLQAAQSTVSGLLTLARSHAATTGRDTAVVVFVGSTSFQPERYLRYVVPVYLSDVGVWESITPGSYLPQECYIVPPASPAIDPAPAFEPSSGWTSLTSSALGFNLVNRSLNSSDSSEDWRGIRFTPRGTTSDSGKIVIAVGRPGSPADTSTPKVTFVNPDNVRGVSVSVYGLARLVNENAGFQ
jgi:type II secretory pathway pseudopilin PulG